MSELDDSELRSRLAALDADPRADWVDAQRRRLAASWESGTITEPRPASWQSGTITEPLASRSTRSRRRRWLGTAAAAFLATVVLVVVVVTLQGVDRRGVQTPLRPVPTTIPDVSKTHAVVVTPSTGLRDGEAIRVSGRNFVVGVGHGGHATPISVVTCRAGATPANWDQQCDRRTSAGTAVSDIRSRTQLRKAKLGQPARKNCCVDVAGYRYVAARHLELPGGAVDCALEPCVVLAVGFDSGYGAAPLQFDANAASLPTPRVTVTPNTDLQEGEQVTIHIEDAWPRSIDNRGGGAVSLCSVSGIAPVCNETDLGVTGVRPIDSHGRADLTMTVRSTVLSTGFVAGATAGVADCAQPPGCVIGVQVPTGPLGGQTVQLAVPITFSSEVSAGPLADRLPQATIDPPGPYADAQTVTITATGVPKGTAVSQCANSIPSRSVPVPRRS